MNTTTVQTVSLDNDLFNEVENFKSAWHYQTSSEALVELVRMAIDYLKEQAEDEYLLALALERKKNDNGIRWSCEDIRRRHGITQEDIDNAEDVEIE